jgi:hypothetical protein
MRIKNVRNEILGTEVKQFMLSTLFCKSCDFIDN